jgi:peptidoglycan/LPS O-acetylase OafA/YrhL
MSRFSRRNLPALFVVVVLALVPASAAQARPFSHSNSADFYRSIGFRGFVHHLWTGLVSLWGADGPALDPNGIKR